jgi:hypothetical protein
VIYGIDPGTTESALVGMTENGVVLQSVTWDNDLLLSHLRAYSARAKYLDDVVVIEQIESMGMAVGREVFETVFWTGRFYEVVYPAKVERIPRRAVKLHLCGSSRAKDKNIKAALIERFGHPGKKKNPGWMYGIKKDLWAALAVGVTWLDLNDKGWDEIHKTSFAGREPW